MNTAALRLHVALSLRLDAIEAYRLAHAYRDEELHKLADRFEGYGGRLLTGEQVAALIRGGKDTGGTPAGESTQPAPDPTPLPVRWDRLVIHPGDTAGPDEPTIVCCIAADTGQPVALFLNDEHREALGLALIDPDGEMDQAPAEDAPDFFQPGHAYTHRDGSDFLCVAVTKHPETGEPRALGWIIRHGWHDAGALDPDDWQHGYDGCQPPADTEGEVPRG